MALTYTPPSDSNQKLPPFSLLDLDGQHHTSNQWKEKILVVMFICNHCPFVRQLEDRILKLVQFFKEKDVRFIGICSNDPLDYPEDSLENLRKRYKQKNYNFTLLFDEKAKVARLFKAVCTPDFFIYDKNRKQAWRGRLDDSADCEKDVKQEEMREAIENLLANLEPTTENPSCGCSIKWSS